MKKRIVLVNGVEAKRVIKQKKNSAGNKSGAVLIKKGTINGKGNSKYRKDRLNKIITEAQKQAS